MIALASRFPRLATYLECVEGGLAAHRDYEAKASPFKFARESQSLPSSYEGLPETIAERLRSPPLPTAWIPEVEFNAAVLAIADHAKLDRDAMRKWWYDSTRTLIMNPLHGFAIKHSTVERLVRGVADRWTDFHRGVKLSAVSTNGALDLVMSFPTGLVPELCVHGYVGCFQAMSDRARRGLWRVHLLECGEDGARYRLTRPSMEVPQALA